MEPETPITVTSTTVGCDGGGGALGHPMIYLEIDAAGDTPGQTTCPYCSRQFVLAEGAAQAAGH